jgi:transcriptional regulator with XRE-family HTH domain
MGAMKMKPRSYPPGAKNIVGLKVVETRLKQGIKQKDFLAQLQVLGMDISATSLSRLEGQYRLVQDFEVVILAEALGITVNELLGVK